MYYRYPQAQQIPVYNKDWHNFYPTDRKWDQVATSTWISSKTRRNQVLRCGPASPALLEGMATGEVTARRSLHHA